MLIERNARNYQGGVEIALAIRCCGTRFPFPYLPGNPIKVNRLSCCETCTHKFGWYVVSETVIRIGWAYPGLRVNKLRARLVFPFCTDCINIIRNAFLLAQRYSQPIPQHPP